MNPMSEGRPYYPALDGLRGLAILLVLLYHNFNFLPFCELGWIGVDLFFVLSGFLITSILLQTRDNKHWLRNFYLNRIFRIFPVYYLCLIVFVLIVPMFHTPFYNAFYYSSNQIWFWLQLQNWLFIIKHPEESSLLNHFWSLAVEEQFYLIWPLMVYCIRSVKILLTIAGTVLIFVVLTRIGLWFSQPYHISYFNLYTFSRIDGLCIGCSIALLRKGNIKSFILQSKVAIGLIILFNAVPVFLKCILELSFPYVGLFGYTSAAWLFGIVIAKAVDTNHNIISKGFSYSILRFLGKISYSLYIVHWPVYLFLFPFLKNGLSFVTDRFENLLLVALLATCCAVFTSMLSYHFIERRFLLLKKAIVNHHG